ncbi:MAG: radical SAM protein [Deltaproteobacteria bacterium]|nr:radical SAM protein [Deltaproteobacteria bacterium]
MSTPRLLYADENGNIYDHPELGLAGSAAGRWEPVDERDCIPLPEGSEMFLLPGRLPVGVNAKGDFEVMDQDLLEPDQTVTAVAAFMAPAHTATLWAAYHTQPGAPTLPLFAYAAVGFARGEFVVTGLRVDPLPRQDAARFPTQEVIASSAKRLLRKYQHNRLWQHLGNCALTYGCPAAKNLMIGRWEAPLPTSPACNASCLGCLSSQPDCRFPATQDRIAFVPEPAEVAEVALHHFANQRDPLVSFGQGCEGEPLLQEDLLAEAIHLIRQKEPTGTINLNTNGSKPAAVARLMREGLTSIRVSVNSLLPARHQAYYQPKGWSLDDAVESIRQVKRAGGRASINLLTLPGVTDQPEEAEALYRLIADTRLDLIQWRNLNIDPEVYLDELHIAPPQERLGIPQLMAEVKKRYPWVRHGYFNLK